MDDWTYRNRIVQGEVYDENASVPTILVLLALTIFPLIFSLALSFSDVSQDNGLTFTDRTLDNWRQLHA